MCRIAGFWDFNFKDQYNLEETAIKMRDSLSHGGPDDAGLYMDLSLGLAISHRRLSILDLSLLGHQPMEFENLVITYNGEVYNFQEIRKELEREGYSFVSNSDTEVILKAFHRWGFDAVHRFRGMFALALWDKSEKRLILCRDRMGVKPLYYFYKDGLFMFASELKAFHFHPKFQKEIESVALSLFLQYGYITSPFSIFKHVYKLEPGHFLILNSRGELSLQKYWDVEEYFREEEFSNLSEEEIAQMLEELLIDSFKLRLVSDVPVGLFLSGGVDSSTVCALLQKELSQPIKTFTIGFYEKDYNEAEYAKRIANYLGTDHTELYCTPEEAFDVIPKLPEIYDEPFGDSSAIPTYLVSKLAKNQVKVSLSADAGDEQFCGYTRYWIVGDRLVKLKRIPFVNLFSQVLELMHPDLALSLYRVLNPILPKWTNFRDKFLKLRNVLKAKTISKQYDLSNKVFLENDIKALGLEGTSFSQTFKVNSFFENNLMKYMMLYDIKTYLPDDILVKVDRATMNVALEGREPFLDHKIVEFTSKIPVDLKYKNRTSKYILRKILYKYVPKELLDRPKMGFGIPIYEWFKRDLKKLYLQYLSSERIKRDRTFNAKEVDRLLRGYLEDRGVNHNKLWFLFVFQLWKEKWL